MNKLSLLLLIASITTNSTPDQLDTHIALASFVSVFKEDPHDAKNIRWIYIGEDQKTTIETLRKRIAKKHNISLESQTLCIIDKGRKVNLDDNTTSVRAVMQEYRSYHFLVSNTGPKKLYNY